MPKPFDVQAVSLVLAGAVEQAFDAEPEDANDDDRVAQLLASYLTIDGGSIPFVGGFKLAVRLCCVVMSDPLRVHRLAVLKAVDDIHNEMERDLKWMRSKREHSDAPKSKSPRKVA
jgi:hypothetical protein